MKTVLVNPPYTDYIYHSDKNTLFLEIPLSIAYIAAWLRHKGHDVDVVEGNAFGMTVDQCADAVVAKKPDLVGITGTTVLTNRIYRIANAIKDRAPQIKICVGGPHVTFMDEVTLEQCDAIDYCARGEGELTLEELAEGLDPDQIDGLTWRQNGDVFRNPDRALIKDVNDIPFPARDLFPLDRYKPDPMFNIGATGYTYGKMITTRGCPDKCSFCIADVMWRRLRMRTAANVVAEMEHLNETYGVRHIGMVDDTITASPKRVIEMANLIRAKKLPIRWTCYSRINTLTPPVIEALANANCFGIEIGVESGDQRILDSVNKKIDIEKVREIVRNLMRSGMKVSAFYMIGLPGETHETVKKTIEVATDLRTHLAFFSMTVPYPGTKIYDLYVTDRASHLAAADWSEMMPHRRSHFRTDDLTTDDIRHYYHQALRKFYMRPSYAWQIARWVTKHPREILNYWTLFKGFLGRNYAKKTDEAEKGAGLRIEGGRVVAGQSKFRHDEDAGPRAGTTPGERQAVTAG